MADEPGLPRSLPRMAAEVAIYAGLVAAYLAFALKALAPFLESEASQHRLFYAFLCVGLMLGQGIALELVTSLLLRLFAWRRPRG